MTDVNNNMMMVVRSQMTSLQRGHPSAQDFPILNKAQLTYYPTLDRDTVQTGKRIMAMMTEGVAVTIEEKYNMKNLTQWIL